jgi:hypothetical protein
VKNFGHLAEKDWQHVRTLDIENIDLEHTWVVTACSNPVRYRSRFDAHRRFVKHMADSGAQLVTVEVTYGEREYEVTETGNPLHVQLRTEFEEIWLKEWMWNVGMKRVGEVDPNWKYIIFCDNDITFTHPRWLSETVHQLQTYMVVQPFQRVMFMGPDNNPELDKDGRPKMRHSFAYMYHQNNFMPPQQAGMGGYYGAETGEFWHPGFAMAFRRECFEGGGLPGLLTVGALGAGDHHMMLCVIGEGARSLPGKIHPNYRKAVMNWQADAERVIKGDLGYVEGLIQHTYGGPEEKRYYVDRWAILEVDDAENPTTGFDPEKDIRVDWSGLPQLVVETKRQRRLRDVLRKYFRAREEDSVLAGGGIAFNRPVKK